MKIGVCGIACEACPRMMKGVCPNGEAGCRPKENRCAGLPPALFEKG
jgi:hypothetical protein